MFTALIRFYNSMQMGMRFSMVANQTAGRPDMLRAFVLAEMAAPAIEPAAFIEVPERELQMAA